MVGAAGFEPATCSTQNCRATRLRYTPPGRAAGYMFRRPAASGPAGLQWPAKAGLSTRSPGRMPSLRAVPPITSRTARTGPPDGTSRSDKRLGVFGNPQDAAVVADKDHVERNVGVVHPERDRLIALENRTACRARPAIPCETSGRASARRRWSQVQRESMNSGLADDLKSRLRRRRRGRTASRSDHGDKRCGSRTRRHSRSPRFHADHAIPSRL